MKAPTSRMSRWQPPEPAQGAGKRKRSVRGPDVQSVSLVAGTVDAGRGGAGRATKRDPEEGKAGTRRRRQPRQQVDVAPAGAGASAQLNMSGSELEQQVGKRSSVKPSPIKDGKAGAGPSIDLNYIEWDFSQLVQQAGVDVFHVYHLSRSAHSPGNPSC